MDRQNVSLLKNGNMLIRLLLGLLSILIYKLVPIVKDISREFLDATKLYANVIKNFVMFVEKNGN